MARDEPNWNRRITRDEIEQGNEEQQNRYNREFDRELDEDATRNEAKAGTRKAQSKWLDFNRSLFKLSDYVNQHEKKRKFSAKFKRSLIKLEMLEDEVNDMLENIYEEI